MTQDQRYPSTEILGVLFIEFSLKLNLLLLPLDSSLPGPLLDPPVPSNGIRVVPAWSVGESYVAVDISLVLKLR